jgi:hypothetical protein
VIISSEFCSKGLDADAKADALELEIADKF